MKKNLVLFIFMILGVLAYSQLSGTYTIGGTSPNYATFSAAVSALNTQGVSGPVVFNVRNGTYNEQISIGSVTGTSAVNTVTFQSESADNTMVTLYYTPTSGANYTILFNGSDYIRFDKMTLRAVGAAYANVIQFGTNTTYNTVSNCIIEGTNTTSTSTNLALVYSGNTGNNGNAFTGNQFTYGSYGIYFYTTTNTSGIQISGNTFSNQYYFGVYGYYLYGVSINSNIITTTSTNTSYNGIYLGYCDNAISVLKNRISGSRGTGISINYCDGGSTARGLIGNNFIQVGGTSSAYGISNANSTYQNYYYNSVNNTSTSTSSSAFYQGFESSSYSNYCQLQNNNFVSTTGYSIYIYYTGAVDATDYNNLYTGGTVLGYWGANYATLAAWQGGCLMDANSVSLNPEYVSSEDLHVQGYLLDDHGYGVGEISDDIDGQPRDVFNPDIGADEWTTPVNDAGITSIDAAQTYCITQDFVYVNLKNFGTTNLTSVTINWEVNSVLQSPYAWTGTLSQGSSAGPINIGAYDFDLGVQYTVRAWTSAPNGGTEGFTHNDEDIISNTYQSMSGTYTIGGTSPDYATIHDAIVDLQNGGVCGPVVFNIRPGVYNVQESIGSITGTSSVNTVTFKSENDNNTSVIWTYTPTSGANYTVLLNGCDYIKLDKMTLRAVGAAYANVIQFGTNTTYNTVSNCIIEGTNTTSTSTNLALVYSGNTGNNGNAFTGNQFTYGSYGIYFYTTTNTSGIQISGNTFSNQYYFGVYGYYLYGVSINSNIITTTSTNTSYNGIYLGYCDNAINVLKNRISGSRGTGISINYCDGGSTARGLIGNNFIQVGGTSSAYGISNANSTYQNYYYNSVNNTSTSTSSSAFYQGFESSSYSNYCQLQNNNFVSTTGYSIYIYYTGAVDATDYNNLYTGGTVLGYWGANYATLAAWQGGCLMDANSVSTNPGYVSSTDLHTCNGVISAQGYPVAEISDDIDGQARDPFTPDIGADEFGTAVSVDFPATMTLCGADYLDAGNPGSTYLWSTGATTQTLLVSTSGTYSVTVTNACGSANDAVNVSVLSELVVDLGSDTTVCGSGSIILDAENTGASFVWSSGGTNQTITVSTPGTYWVDVTDGGCTGHDEITVSFATAPTSTFNLSSTACATLPTTVTYTGTGSPLATYSWNFDGGTASPGNGQGPHTVSWTTPGTHNITLTVYENGCYSTLTNHSIAVSATPTNTFSVSDLNICEGETPTITYTGSGTIGATYTWDFGSGVVLSGSGQGPYVVSYSNDGSESISLIVSEGGCTSLENSVNIIVNTIPLSTFSATSTAICSDDNITASYTGGSPGSAVYTWNFDGGIATPGTGQGPHTVEFLSGGTYDLSLMVTYNGCSSVLTTIPISVTETPTSYFNISPATICAYDTATITYTGNASTGAIYNWNYDGATILSGTGQGPYQVYFSGSGSHNLTLTVSEGGCVSEQSNDGINVLTSPTGTFAVSDNNICSGDTIIVSYTGTGTGSAIYTWDYDGAIIFSGIGQGPFEITWDEGGTFDIQLQVTESGCSSMLTTQTVTVTQTPESVFTVSTPVCIGQDAVVTFTGTAGPTATYTWDFDGATTSPTGQGPHAINWTADGLVNVSLIVSEFGCSSDLFSLPVSVNPVPVQPTINQVGSVLASSSSSNNQWYYNGTPIDGATGQFYTATVSGFYQVEVTNIYGCSSISDMLNVIITGMDNNENGEEIIIYPNPVDGTLYISAIESTSETIYILRDVDGRIISEGILNQNEVTAIDLNSVAVGSYFISLSNNKFIRHEKVIVR